jgi:transcriptional regulator with GAF, ATPase, and Fis domain
MSSHGDNALTKGDNERHVRPIYPGDMTAELREQRLAAAFVELADTLVDDFDVLDFLHVLAARCVDLLDVSAAGLMLADPTGVLRLAAASTERARLLELFELQNEEGPCLECFASGDPVLAADLGGGSRDLSHWPRFASETRAAGFRSVAALPLRLRDETIGALNLFREQPDALGPEEIALGQALADVATIGILQERGARRREVLAQQLQSALNSRIVIEQAKGVIAERTGLDMDDAFRLLRQAARSRHEHLSDTAAKVVTGRLDVADTPKAKTEPRR